MSDSLATTNFTLSPGAEIGGEFPIALNVKAVGAVGDGITDDTEAIQYALSLAQSVFLPYGIYNVCGLEVPSNRDFFGLGPQSILRVMDNAKCPYAIVNEDQEKGNHHITIRDMAIDGNKAKSGPIPSASILMTAEDTGSCELVNVERVYVKDGNSLGIVFVNCIQFQAVGNIVAANNRDGITCYFNCQRGLIANNRIERCNDDSIGLNAENEESEEHNLFDVLVTGNVIYGEANLPGSYGAVTVRGARQCAIVGNVIDRVKQHGILAVDMNNTPVGDLLIANNLLCNVGLGGEGFRPAIALYAGLIGEAGINDVTIAGNHIREAATHGIFLENDLEEIDGVQNVNIVDNSIERCGFTNPPAAPAANGIHINDSTMQGLHISGNVSHHHTGYGILAVTFGNRLQQVFVNDNVCFDNEQSGIYLSGIVGGAAIGNATFNQETHEEGGPQQWGIRIRGGAGEWAIHGNVAFNNTRDYEYAVMGGAQFRDSLFGAEPVLKPVITGKREGNPALTSLLKQGAIAGYWTDLTT